MAKAAAAAGGDDDGNGRAASRAKVSARVVPKWPVFFYQLAAAGAEGFAKRPGAGADRRLSDRSAARLFGSLRARARIVCVIPAHATKQQRRRAPHALRPSAPPVVAGRRRHSLFTFYRRPIQCASEVLRCAAAGLLLRSDPSGSIEY